jgi:hypothetical protein
MARHREEWKIGRYCSFDTYNDEFTYTRRNDGKHPHLTDFYRTLMKKILKPAAIILLFTLIIIQFFHPTKNIAAADEASSKNIIRLYAVPKNVQDILKTSCNDCHSNNTRYPWYAKVQPFAWWLDNHIQEGKRELNFSEFADYAPRRKYKKMEEVIDEVKEEAMPLASYTLLHRDARLNKEQKDMLINWANSVREILKATYPPDSLKKAPR